MKQEEVHQIKNTTWNEFHKTKQFVTGTGIDDILGWHQVSRPNGKLVMDIGVGLGAFIEGLSNTNTMIGVDVSKDLLNNVKRNCKEVYLSNDLKETEEVDLAMCSLVLQHNHEFEVTRIINDVNLKDDGMFSFQFATLNLQKSALSPMIMEDINKSMMYFYSVDKMREIVGRTNKKIIKEIGPIWFGQPFGFDWYIFHVTKNK